MAKTNNASPALFSRGGLLRALGTLLAVGLLTYVLVQQDWREIVDAVVRIQPIEFLAAVGLMALSRLFVAARWHVLLRSGGVKATWDQSLRITLAGLFATNFLPTTIGGDVARLAGAIQFGFDATVSAASLIADRVVGLVGMVFVLPLGLPFLGQINTAQVGTGVAVAIS
ncbi:MAG TPA: lysylphosphatidylglycerol synthase transmembrane domain-containing protein, partial [Terriglobales bacterium]|nr:lysylphosphatidylglycerol synthase transmembrane domain-containing protein [Terriglobales bacterium]